MLSEHKEMWGFIYNFSKISNFKKDELLKYCSTAVTKYFMNNEVYFTNY